MHGAAIYILHMHILLHDFAKLQGHLMIGTKGRRETPGQIINPPDASVM